MDNFYEELFMPNYDLFGNNIPDKTEKPTYRAYLSSSKWKKKCIEKKDSVGNKCEKCGRDKFMRKLIVHHLTYEHFGDEPLEDLQVLCDICHHPADWKREREVAERNYEKLEEARFQGWARVKYGDDWMLYHDTPETYEDFQDWRERNQY